MSQALIFGEVDRDEVDKLIALRDGLLAGIENAHDFETNDLLPIAFGLAEPAVPVDVDAQVLTDFIDTCDTLSHLEYAPEQGKSLRETVSIAELWYHGSRIEARPS